MAIFHVLSFLLLYVSWAVKIIDLAFLGLCGYTIYVLEKPYVMLYVIRSVMMFFIGLSHLLFGNNFGSARAYYSLLLWLVVYIIGALQTTTP